MKIRVVIVDSNDAARRQLSGFLKAEPDVTVVGACGGVRDAILLLKRFNPDAVFLDVQLQEAGGFEVLAALDPQHLPLVVFVAEHGRYAARAFEMGAIDYLVKPLDARRFGLALARVRRKLPPDTGAPGRRVPSRANDETASPAASVAPVHSTAGQSLDRIMVKDRGRIYFVRTLEIDWIQSADNYVRIHVAKNIHLIRHSLKHLGACLDAHRFARIHRCTIVNLDRVCEIQPGVGREHVVILKDGTRLKLSQRYRLHLERQAELGR